MTTTQRDLDDVARQSEKDPRIISEGHGEGNMVRHFVLIAMLITLLACNVSPAEPTTPATPRPVVIPTSELGTMSAAEFEQKLRAAGYSDEAVNRALTGFNARREQATSILSHRQVFEAVDREVRNADPLSYVPALTGGPHG